MNTHTTVDPDLVEMMESVFATHRTALPHPGDAAAFDPKLWAVLGDLGLARLTGGESHGGSGADWHASAVLLAAAAAAAVHVPIAEHDLLAGWLLETAGLPMDGRLRTALLLTDPREASVVPWARDAEFLVALRRTESSWMVSDIARERATITTAQNVAASRGTASQSTSTMRTGPQSRTTSPRPISCEGPSPASCKRARRWNGSSSCR